MAQGSRKRPLIPLDEAQRPARRLQVVANLRRLIRRAERTSKGTVIDTRGTQIDTLHTHGLRAKNAWVLALQDPVRRLRVGLILLRRDLHQIPATASTGGGLRRSVGCDPRTRVCSRGRLAGLRR